MATSIDKTKLPKHIAIIMDGNGRWAKSKNLPRLEGHRRGTEVAEDIIEHAQEIGIKHLTLYAFSRENWERPPEEVSALMELLLKFLVSKKEKMLKNGISLNAIGDLKLLPQDVSKLLEETISETKRGRTMVLTLALSYGSRNEILRATKRLFIDFQERKKDISEIDQDSFANYLDTKDLPDPDLIIRTSGEYRISNFLLWQSAYAELIFVEENWPEFNKTLFDKCLQDFEHRERRFGLTSEQLDD